MYVEAGLRAEQAGFDLLEVSAGDDTLPMQFLEPRFNRRTDRWGGSFENRSRFFIEVLHALKRRLGDALCRSRRASRWTRCTARRAFEAHRGRGAHAGALSAPRGYSS